MATKRKPKAKTPKLKEGQQIDLTIVPDYSDLVFPSYYANFAYVSHTNSEIILDFCLVALPYNVDVETKEARAPIQARIILPPRLMNGLIKALEAQKDKQIATAKSESIAIPLGVGAKR